MNLVVWHFWFEEKVYFTSFEGTYQIEIFSEISHTKPTQGQKNLSFQLQSAPNLHGDKKKQSTWEESTILLFFFSLFVPVQVWCTLKLKTFVFLLPAQVLDTVVDFRVHQTCTRTKKQKFWTSKGTKPAQGPKKNKKNKEKSIYWRRVDYPSKVFVFLSLCRFGAFWSSKLLFFWFLCRFGALWSLQCWFFCPCAGCVHFQVQNPMHGYMCIVTLFPLFASYCASTCIFGFPCSFLKGQVHFSCKGLTIWR